MKPVERIHVLSRASALQPLRHLFCSLIEKYNFSANSVNDVVMALNEACMNVIQHAYCNLNDGEIIVEIVKQDNGLLIRVIDYAQHSDLSKIQSRELDDVRPGGLGVHLIETLVNKVEYKNMQGDSGNILELHKYFDKK